MKKTLLIALAALSMTATRTLAQTATAPVDTLRAYFIDGKPVKNFTGAELVGKTIKKYDIIPSTYDNKDGKGFSHVLLLHDITTDHAPAKTASTQPLVFIDGIMDANGMNTVKPADIVSMTVIKDPKILKVYKEMGLSDNALKKGVVRIVTKKQKVDPIVYLVDGAEMTYAEILKIPADKIKSMNVYKRGNDHKYAAKYGKKKDVVEITTK